jgi:uncharacterized membrane protein
MPMEAIHSKAAIVGHPLHPVLIHFPVAALVGLVGSDAAWLLTGITSGHEPASGWRAWEPLAAGSPVWRGSWT